MANLFDNSNLPLINFDDAGDRRLFEELVMTAIRPNTTPGAAINGTHTPAPEQASTNQPVKPSSRLINNAMSQAPVTNSNDTPPVMNGVDNEYLNTLALPYYANNVTPPAARGVEDNIYQTQPTSQNVQNHPVPAVNNRQPAKLPVSVDAGNNQQSPFQLPTGLGNSTLPAPTGHGYIAPPAPMEFGLVLPPMPTSAPPQYPFQTFPAAGPAVVPNFSVPSADPIQLSNRRRKPRPNTANTAITGTEDDQERKRKLNTEAARRCRQNRNNEEQNLRSEIVSLKMRNAALEAENHRLRAQLGESGQAAAFPLYPPHLSSPSRARAHPYARPVPASNNNNTTQELTPPSSGEMSVAPFPPQPQHQPPQQPQSPADAAGQDNQPLRGQDDDNSPHAAPPQTAAVGAEDSFAGVDFNAEHAAMEAGSDANQAQAPPAAVVTTTTTNNSNETLSFSPGTTTVTIDATATKNTQAQPTGAAIAAAVVLNSNETPAVNVNDTDDTYMDGLFDFNAAAVVLNSNETPAVNVNDTDDTFMDGLFDFNAVSARIGDAGPAGGADTVAAAAKLCGDDAVFFCESDSTSFSE